MNLIVRNDRQSREVAGKGLGKLLGIGKPVAPDEETSLDIGARWELVTERLDGAQKILQHVVSLAELVEQIRGPIADEFRERHAEHAELHGARFALEQVQTRLKDAEIKNQQLTSRLAISETALAEVTQQRETATGDLDNKIRELEQVRFERSEARVRVAELSDSLKEALLRSRQYEEDAAHSREQADSADHRRRETEVAAASLQQELHLAQDEITVLRANLERSDADGARLGRIVEELEGRLRAEHMRVQELDQGLRALQASSAESTRIAESNAESARLTISALTTRADMAQARAAKLEELNSELSRSVNEAVGKHRAADHELAEARVNAQRTRERIRSVEEELSGLRRDFASIEAARSAAVERADDLSQALKARDGAIKRSEERAEDLRAKLETLLTEQAQRRAGQEERLTHLEAQMERERAERAIVESSLEAARADRARLQSELLSVGGCPDLSATDALEIRRN